MSLLVTFLTLNKNLVPVTSYYRYSLKYLKSHPKLTPKISCGLIYIDYQQKNFKTNTHSEKNVYSKYKIIIKIILKNVQVYKDLHGVHRMLGGKTTH